MRARVYARVSTKEQVEGYSIPAQTEAAENWAQSKSHVVTGEYVDEGKSGKTANRPQLQQALEDARQGKYDILVVHKLDRLSRSLLDTMVILGELNKCGITLVSVNENFDFTTPMGKIFLGMVAMLAEWFLGNLAQEVKKGNQQKVKEGYFHGKVAPAGYRFKDGLLTPHQQERETVLTAHELYATSRYTISELARVLREKHLGIYKLGSAKIEEYVPITQRLVQYILNNHVYCGEIVYLPSEQKKLPTFLRTPTIVEGKHEPIVSKELWLRCQEVLRKQARGGKGAHKFARDFIFGGKMLVCIHCGVPLQGRMMRKEGQVYYACFAKWQDRTCSSSAKWVNESLLLEQMEALIASIRLPGDWEQRIVAIANNPQKQDEREVKRRNLLERRRRLRVMYYNGGISDDKYVAEERKLTIQIDSLPEIITTQAQLLDAGKTIISLPRLWQEATREEKRILLRLLASEIKVDADRRIMVSFKAQPSFQFLFQAAGLEQEGEYYQFPPLQLEPPVWAMGRKGAKYTYDSYYQTKEEKDDKLKQLREAGYNAMFEYIKGEGFRLPDGSYICNCYIVFKKESGER